MFSSRPGSGQMRQYAGMASPANWLDRYRAGQRDLIWHELRQLGGAVRQPGLMEQAQLVCDEMALRARQNVEVIIERLTDAGYRFHTNDDAQDPETPTSRRHPGPERTQNGWRNGSGPCR
jgi:hypothetical protein